MNKVVAKGAFLSKVHSPIDAIAHAVLLSKKYQRSSRLTCEGAFLGEISQLSKIPFFEEPLKFIMVIFSRDYGTYAYFQEIMVLMRIFKRLQLLYLYAHVLKKLSLR